MYWKSLLLCFSLLHILLKVTLSPPPSPSPITSSPTTGERLLPEEFLNQRQYIDWRKLEYSKLLASIEQKFSALLPKRFREFQFFVSLCVSDLDHREAILHSATTRDIFNRLSVGNYISENNRELLHTLLQAFGDTTVSSDEQNLVKLDVQIEFVDIALELADAVAERCSIDQLKLCVLCTQVEFGRYYKRLEREVDARTTLIMVVQDYKHPRLLHRVARHFHPTSVDRLERNTRARKPPTKQLSLVEFLEKYADILMAISCYIVRNPQELAEFLGFFQSIRVSRKHPSLRLTTLSPSSVYDGLLSLVPFTSYHSPTLLQLITNNFCDTNLTHRLQELTTAWGTFVGETAISEIYDVQLDFLPLELTERGIVILTLHVVGDQWQQPTIKTATDLAQDTATEFSLYPWSVVYYRSVFSGSEPGRKGECKVEMLLPALAACVILRDGDDRLHHWQNHSVVYLELLVENECYLSSDARFIGDMYQRAQGEKFFAPHFEVLNNVVCVPS